MVGKGLQIGRLFGIKIKLDWSWLLIFLLVSWNLTAAFGGIHPDWSMGLSIAVAVVAAILFFLSVLAHELAHALAAIAQGLPVRSITLFLFGGVANIEREPPSPRVEFVTPRSLRPPGSPSAWPRWAMLSRNRRRPSPIWDRSIRCCSGWVRST